MQSRIAVARIVKARGIKGEVAAEILTEFPERFGELDRVFLVSDETEQVERLESFWFHKKRVILKFRGRDRPHEVEDLIGSFVEIPESERFQTPPDTYFDSDLVGAAVYDGSKKLGVVERVIRVRELASLLLRREDSAELEVPMVRAFIREVSVEEGRILVRLPPGYEDLASPTLRSKKQRSR